MSCFSEQVESSEVGCFCAGLGLGSKVSLEKLAGDGSTRAYYRVNFEGGETAVLMNGPDSVENAGFVRIARHLSSKGVRVPEVFGVEGALGWVLLEDLGDTNLYDMVRRTDDDGARIRLISEVLPTLRATCVEGAMDFTYDIATFKTSYDAGLMVREEGLYFLDEMADGVLGLDYDRHAVETEIRALAAYAQKITAGGQDKFLVHRDFQSRNLMLKNGAWVVIDFQGARPGPLAYDAAAFILDPYVENSPAVRDELLKRYGALLEEHPAVEREVLELSLGPVGAFRLMQALGAYAKLGHRFGKPGFLEHTGAGLANLGWLLKRCCDDGHCPSVSRLTELASRGLTKWNL